ncbi:class F sortase [Arthrobacter sp. D1-17]
MPAAPTSSPAPHAGTTAPAETSVPSNGLTAPQKVLPASDPISVSIPSVGIESDLLSLGLKEDGSLEVPPDGPGAPASWYNGSPTPGERGPAILLGHVNATDGGPGVFANLRDLKAGDVIRVPRQDGTTSVFAFDHADHYSKDAFPTQSVYGNTEGPELRLITCDGFDPATGQFDDNYVVYAKLVA